MHIADRMMQRMSHNMHQNEGSFFFFIETETDRHDCFAAKHNVELHDYRTTRFVLQCNQRNQNRNTRCHQDKTCVFPIHKFRSNPV